MTATPSLRNIAMLTGFAWQQDGQWLLQQRAPLPMALPFRLAVGARAPEQGEPVDVIGHMDATDGLHLRGTHLARAAKSSFPERLVWAVQGIHTAGKPGVKNVLNRDEKDRLNPGVAETLLPERTIPDRVREACASDFDLADWVDESLRTATRLCNRAMLTGVVLDVIACDNAYASHPSKAVYYDVLMRVAPEPAPPIVCRLTSDVRACGVVAKALHRSRGNLFTILAEYRAKVIPSDDDKHEVARVDYHLRATDVFPATRSDAPEGIPGWVHPSGK